MTKSNQKSLGYYFSSFWTPKRSAKGVGLIVLEFLLRYFLATKSNQKLLGEADLSKNQTTRMFVKTRQRLTRLLRQLTNKEVFMRCLIFVYLKSAYAQTQNSCGS